MSAPSAISVSTSRRPPRRSRDPSDASAGRRIAGSNRRFAETDRRSWSTGGIRHDADAFVAALVERAPDRRHPPVHHVRRRDEISASTLHAIATLREVRDGRIVQDLLAIDDAAVAVRGVFAEADIGHDDQVRQRTFQRTHRLLHGASGSAASDPISSFPEGRPNRITPGTPSARAASASLTASSWITGRRRASSSPRAARLRRRRRTAGR